MNSGPRSTRSSSQSTAVRLLEGAYALRTAADNRAYYRSFSACYDDQFADALGYYYPQQVANELLQQIDSQSLAGAICDIGCGTGLVAAALLAVRPELTLDGADISPHMLTKARDKQLYRALYEVDLSTAPLTLPNDYAAMVSAGTFTHGHLGPQPLTTLIGHCRAGALVIIGVNALHYVAQRFAAHLNALAQHRLITLPTLTLVPVYRALDSVADAPCDNPDAAPKARGVGACAELKRHTDDNAFLIRFTVC